MTVAGLLVAAATVAWFLGADSRQPLLDQLNASKRQLEGEVETLTTKTTALERRITLLDARRLVSRSAEALVARNFGTAEAELVAAAALLRSGDEAELATHVAALKIQITEDIEPQRDALVNVAQEIDRKLGQ